VFRYGHSCWLGMSNRNSLSSAISSEHFLEVTIQASSSNINRPALNSSIDGLHDMIPICTDIYSAGVNTRNRKKAKCLKGYILNSWKIINEIFPTSQYQTPHAPDQAIVAESSRLNQNIVTFHFLAPIMNIYLTFPSKHQMIPFLR
jgi:hypothetical protein